MLEIKIERFEAQDIITSSGAEPRCDCDIIGCRGITEAGNIWHETTNGSDEKGYLACYGYDYNGSHTCGK